MLALHYCPLYFTHILPLTFLSGQYKKKIDRSIMLTARMGRYGVKVALLRCLIRLIILVIVRIRIQTSLDINMLPVQSSDIILLQDYVTFQEEVQCFCFEIQIHECKMKSSLSSAYISTTDNQKGTTKSVRIEIDNEIDNDLVALHVYNKNNTDKQEIKAIVQYWWI